MSLRTEINGSAASAEDLASLAQVNYGHFTSMQVRERGVRGFALHLDRLERSTLELFGIALDRECVREWTRRMIDDEPASLRITVFSRALDRNHLERPMSPDVMIARSSARDTPIAPLRIRSIVYERVLPHVKHVGTFGLFHFWRQARLAGWDDVLFTTAQGLVSEGSIWNIGFWDGSNVVWPDAPALPGITWQLLDSGLSMRSIRCERRHVNIGDMSGLRSAFIMNSGAVGRPIERIDEHAFVVDAELGTLLQTCYEAQPLERI